MGGRSRNSSHSHGRQPHGGQHSENQDYHPRLVQLRDLQALPEVPHLQEEGKGGECRQAAAWSLSELSSQREAPVSWGPEKSLLPIPTVTCRHPERCAPRTERHPRPLHKSFQVEPVKSSPRRPNQCCPNSVPPNPRPSGCQKGHTREVLQSSAQTSVGRLLRQSAAGGGVGGASLE